MLYNREDGNEKRVENTGNGHDGFCAPVYAVSDNDRIFALFRAVPGKFAFAAVGIERRDRCSLRRSIRTAKKCRGESDGDGTLCRAADAGVFGASCVPAL